jgi:hypothetical protein
MKHIIHIRLLAALFLSATFFSCDKDNQISDNPTTGEEVFIQIRTLEIAESNEDDLSLAASLQDSEPEYTPTGDGLLVNMSMEEDGQPLRAVKDLIPDAWFRVIAVKTGTSTYISHGDFQQGGMTSLPTFHVTANADYDIICFSYNKATNTLPAFNPARYDDISAINLSGDLENLLWQIQTIHVGTTDPSLSFLLNYKAARVRVVVDCTYNNWTITNIANTMKLNSLALAQSVNLMTGSPSGGSAAEQTVTWPTLSASNKQTSNPFIVMPTANSVNLTVSIPVGSISRQTYTQIPSIAGYTGKFTATLQGGRSYNLLVKLKAPKFAGSNIYWNGGQLTFDLHGVTGNQYRQGVYFRYGSLMGLSTASIAFVGNTTTVYIPGSPGTDWPSWATVPYISSGSIGADNLGALTGDICRYLGTIYTNLAGYRLPTISEFGVTGGEAAWNTTTPIRGGWVNGRASWPAGDNNNKTAEGTSDLSGYGYARNFTMNDLRFPSAGYRWYANGNIDAIGVYGFYRTSTPVVFEFVATSINLSRAMETTFGFSVRCVMN